MSQTSLPADKGTYLVLMTNARARRITVGSLGLLDFPAGDYLYIGSAFGPGGLRARLGRHLGRPSGRRWHVDFLHPPMKVRGALYATHRERRECRWSEGLRQAGGQPLLAGLGASDCRCRSHLLYWPEVPAPAQLEEILQESLLAS